MNAASVIVLAAVVACAALVVWRNLKKGAPCSCGECDCCGCACTCGGTRGARALPEGGSRCCATVDERALLQKSNLLNSKG